MQVFAPYPCFDSTARVLDRKRLGKQRVESKQIILGQFPHHPATIAWQDHRGALARYTLCIIREWKRRGYVDNLEPFFLQYADDSPPPPWWGDENFHASHRAALLWKALMGDDFEWYEQWGWTEEPKIDYVWP